MATVKLSKGSKILVRGMEWMDEQGRMRYMLTKPYVELTRHELNIHDYLNNTAYNLAMEGKYKTGCCNTKIGSELRKIGVDMRSVTTVMTQRLRKTNPKWKTKNALAMEIVYEVEETGEHAKIKEVQKIAY